MVNHFLLGKSSLVVTYCCYCAFANENSDKGNQKATSEYGVSFKRKLIAQFISSFTLL